MRQRFKPHLRAGFRLDPGTGRRDGPRSSTLLALLVLAALAVISVDSTGAGSPVESVRGAVGSVLGPVQSGFSAADRPFSSVFGYFTTVHDLRDRNATLAQDNARMRAQLDTTTYLRNQLAEYSGLAAATAGSGLATVDAHVVGLGSAQSFSRTATIDVGTADGVRADMTVLDAHGLVGRVVHADAHSSTVLLLIDATSVVGGRLSASMELGFLRGSGDVSGDGHLTMTTLDPKAVPTVGDTVVSWGSSHSGPYVAGVPIGRVTAVVQSPRDQSATATIAPYADFSALDVVAVVTGRPARSSQAAPPASTSRGH
ncbi:MAG: rod shape-determining protein MreC [Nocardioidaceae bacterium]